MVTINGVVQEPDYAYTIDGRILRFVDESSTVIAPEDEARIDVRFLSAPAYNGVRRYEYTGDGSTRTYAVNIDIVDSATVMVFVENIYQDPAVYTTSGKTITFNEEAPAVGDRISIIQFATIISPNVVTRQEVDDAAIAFAIALG
jgi:ABC-type sulfate transport system substrate-binding protein